MRNITRAASLVAAALFVQMAPASFLSQPGNKSVTTTPPRAETPKVRGTGPVHEPSDSNSAIFRREQAARKVLRADLDWNNLDPLIQDALWDEAVGPDQLNDGHGRAQRRPSPVGNGGIGDRGDDGGIKDRGINLVEMSWEYTTPATSINQGGTDTQAFDMDLNVEGDVSFVGTVTHPYTNRRIKIAELRGVADSTEGYTKNWELLYNMAPVNTNENVNLFLEGRGCASDLLGNLYVCSKRGNGQYHIGKMNGKPSAPPLGERLVDMFFDVTATSEGATPLGILVDPEGILYVYGIYTEGSTTRSFVARHEPDPTLTRTWIVTFDFLPDQGKALKCDRNGTLYFLNTNAANVATVLRLSPYDGFVEWTWSGPAGSATRALDLDFQGSPHVAVYTGATNNKWRTAKLNALTGAEIWSQTISNGDPVDLKVDGNGNVFVLGSKGSNTTHLVKYDSAGNAPSAFTRPLYGTTGEAVKLVLDWIGNPYVCVTYGTTHMSTDTRKFDPVKGAVFPNPPNSGVDDGEVWHFYRSPANGNEINGDVFVKDMIVDASGSVYICGYRQAVDSSGGLISKEQYFIKYEQPYLGIPLIAKSNPTMSIEGNSLWRPQSPEFSGPVAEWTNKHLTLFEFDATALLGNIDYLTQASVDYALGTAAGGLDVNFNNAVLGASFDTDVSGGTYDAKATGELAIAVPGEDDPTLNPGQEFTLTVNFDPDSNGMELTTQGRPTLSAGLNAYARTNIGVDIFGTETTLGIDFREPILNDGTVDIEHQVVGLDLLASNVKPGTWFDLVSLLPPIAGSYIDGRIRMPEMGTDGVYSAGTTGPVMTSTLREPMIETSLRLTNMLTALAGQPPLSYGWSPPVGASGWDAEIGIGLLQANLNGTISLEQDLVMTMRPYVDLVFDDASDPHNAPSRLYMTASTDSQGHVSYQGTKTVHLPSDGNLTITPTFGVRGKMTNQTGFRFSSDVTFDAFNFNAQLEVADVKVLDLDFPANHTLEWDLLSENTRSGVSSALNGGRLNILDTTSGANAAQEFDFPNEQEMAPVVVASSSTNNLPQLIGSSRASARMIIYEQVTPSSAEFQAAVIGDEPMVLYGRKFFSDQHCKVFIKHYGRKEQLTITRLNDQSLLVQVPKRFFLLPGVARLWVHDDFGDSETIDFPIEYPLPNFQGLEDPIWAGDPKWVNSPVVAIDGLTPAGLGSFIARRDYYTRLKSLWLTAFPLLPAAESYFPKFKGWETTAIKSPPGFPTLIMDGVPLARKAHPSGENGKLWSSMQASIYASPKLDLAMTLVNPGPGGGASRTQYIDIPAPRPVIQKISPQIVPPGSVSGSLKLTVTGPDSVPFFPGGYEQPKYGNFTPQSVVMVNTTAMPTEFVSSGQLIATIPASQFASFGNKSITVVTPGNGTTYYERQLTGSGAVSFDGQVASGGTSVPVTLDVAWPAPTVDAVSNQTITVNSPPPTALAVNGVPVVPGSPESYNFSVSGTNFAPNAKVYWNGTALPSFRVSEGIVRATLTAAQVAQVGTARVSVANPASSGSARQSRPFSVQIVP